jgi:hypothetical protein
VISDITIYKNKIYQTKINYTIAKWFAEVKERKVS